MPKTLFKGIILVTIIVMLAGCRANRLSSKVYYEDRPRVDQEMTGNFGYIQGQPVEPDRSGHKTTRRYYVWEITEKPGDNARMNEDMSGQESWDMQGSYETDAIVVTPREPTRNYTFGDAQGQQATGPSSRTKPSAQATDHVMYTVEKNDTLQKIAKKFYDSYSKWPKIYEYNREIISNPHRIKPGLVLKIPQE